MSEPDLGVCVGVLIMASSGFYIFEQEAQPDACGSIPSAIWWAVAKLTTVGYSDVTDHGRAPTVIRIWSRRSRVRTDRQESRWKSDDASSKELLKIGEILGDNAIYIVMVEI